MNLFAFFHLNLAYSSIEVEQRAEVIRKCYWPLLDIVADEDIPLGFEASGHTLREIERLDPEWIERAKGLIAVGKLELIASGWIQCIGPLVPWEVNVDNQLLGLAEYKRLLGISPDIALVNEQAYSRSMVDLYLEAGFQSILMEWENALSANRGWPESYRYYPQYALGNEGKKIKLIWNQSILFQLFQRYVFGELSIDEYVKNLTDGGEGASICIYGNDTEIFNFRPGRYHTEAVLKDEIEWSRIKDLFSFFKSCKEFNLILPSAVLELCSSTNAGQILSLESGAQPIPVKKQNKYNINRWANTGRDDFTINSLCYRNYRDSKLQELSDDEKKSDLLFWSSDLRTHITDKRWDKVFEKIKQRHSSKESKKIDEYDFKWVPVSCISDLIDKNPELHNNVIVSNTSREVIINGEMLQWVFDLRKGLALKRLKEPHMDVPVICTLPLGYYNDIQYAADFYSGHFILEIPNMHKVTDLNSVDCFISVDNNQVSIMSVQESPFGPVEKIWTVDLDGWTFKLRLCVKWPEIPLGTFRMGHLTLFPEYFDNESLFYATHNGGRKLERFCIYDEEVEHLNPVNSLISSRSALGCTEGEVEIGDKTRKIRIQFDPGNTALTGHVHYKKVLPGYFVRLGFSAMEMDDTSANVKMRRSFSNRSFEFTYQFIKG